MIHNPILAGFHPDPSILRVGEVYYIANSTFEWWPGVILHESRDLVHWQLCGYALTRRSQLDMRGNPCSGGVWAPALSHDGELFYLIYSDVKALNSPYKDVHNYLVTATSITGPWSEPVYLNGRGFDPSLCHDHDGRKWLVQMLWDHRAGRSSFGGVLLQEYSVAEERLIGESINIFQGSSLGATEGPHLYRIGQWYYLVVAEGGTGYGHAVTVARSRSITGPYEISPVHPLLTTRDHPDWPLQKAGHGSLVATPGGEWFLAHLCARPVTRGGEKRCPLGRETALQRIRWNAQEWPELDGAHGNLPEVEAAPPALPAAPTEPLPACDHFDSPTLHLMWNTLREPANGAWLDLRARPGWLRLHGRESMDSRHCQSLVGRRLQSLDGEMECALDFQPASFQQMAGLSLFYKISAYFQCVIAGDETHGRVVRLVATERGKYREIAERPIDRQGVVTLRVTLQDSWAQFSTATVKGAFTPLGEKLDVTLLSDECSGGWGFTGCYVTLSAHDLTGARLAADFDYFKNSMS